MSGDREVSTSRSAASASTPATPRAQDSSSGPQVSSAQPTDRSCAVCHRRKVRCDKRVPCAACVRGGHECVYHDLGRPRRRRTRQTTIATVASRLSELEKSIGTGNTGATTSPASNQSAIRRGSSTRALADGTHSTPLTAYTPAPHDTGDSSEVLVQNGVTSQYVDESVISRMIEADRDRNSLLTTPEDAVGDQFQGSPFSLMGILSHPSAFHGESDHVISKTNGMKLWQTFVQNIDPFVKVLHIPTAEVEVFTAINHPETVAKDTIALMHAVYFAAATSMEAEDVLKMLGMEQVTALAKFKTHFQKALAEADILENPTVTLLQAFAIYLHIVPSWNSSRGSWILNGLALRVALTIGLHTDGSKLGLSPFDAELRRRVWWHLYARDFRALEDHGISPQLHLPMSTTRMPLNIEDSDLRPDMTELPPPRPGWTHMTFPVVNIEVSNAFHQTIQPPNAVMEPGERMAMRDEVFDGLRSRVAGYFASCHPMVPLQKFTLRVGQAILHKMDLVTRQQVANLETPDNRDSFATEENLDAACTILETNIDIWHDELLRPHRWSQRVHPQYFMVLYVLWHLCTRPESPQADRAWGVVDGMFRVEQQRLTHAFAGPSLKRVVLERMRKKAEALRASVLSGGGNGNRIDNDSAGAQGAANPVTAQLDFDMDNLQQNQMMDDLNVDWFDSLGGTAVPNWNTLVSDLRGDFHMYPGMF